jgi:hypothetical protein
VLLGAILAGMMAVVMGVGVSSARAIDAPEITAHPNNPNTTHGVVNFNYQKATGDTSTINRFQCRTYPTDTPPSGTAGYAICGSATGITSSSKTYALGNGDFTFEVRAGLSSTYGPSTTFSWTNNVPDPSVPPVLTGHPAAEESGYSAGKATFTFTGGTGEENLPTQFRCRIDGGAWAACNGGTVSYTPLANGGHLFEVEAGSAAVWTDATSYEWTTSVPNPGVNYRLDDFDAPRYNSDTAGASLGTSLLSRPNLLGAGDVNNDGRDDMVATIQGARAGIVVFGKKNASGTQSLLNVSASQGYRIELPSGVTTTYFNVTPVGDQNGDDRADFLATYRSNTVNPAAYEAAVVYGVANPADLPACASAPASRCLSLGSLTDEQGYRLNTPASPTAITSVDVLDWDGDGVKDFWFDGGDPNLIVKGGIRSGLTDVTTLPSSDLMRVHLDSAALTTPSSGGVPANPLGDLNGDGKDDALLLRDVYSAGGAWIYYGRGFDPSSSDIFNIEPIGPDDGVMVASPPLGLVQLANIGDLNGDSRPDLLTNFFSLGALAGGSLAQSLSTVYMPEQPTENPILLDADMEPGSGYLTTDQTEGALGMGSIQPLGDMNGDGVPDYLAGQPISYFDGTMTGTVYVLFGKKSVPEGGVVNLNNELTPDNGLSISGPAEGAAQSSALGSAAMFGTQSVPLGDLDGDGIPDFATTAPGLNYNGLSGAGSAWIIYGKELFGSGQTAAATGVTDKTAVLNASVTTNDGDAELKFEYGTDTDYGQTSDPETIADSNGASVGSVNVSGLSEKTTYHYRAVVKNQKGLVHYGQDRTFTTGATPPPEGCAADNTLPGCPGWDRCKDDSTQPGCKDYDYCKANASKPECKAPQAKLSGLIVSVAQPKVKRGKKTTAKATIVNTGTAAAAGTKVCLTAPKKMIGGAKCVNVGSLGAGASKTVKFKVKVKKKAKKGKKVALKFKASANGLGSKTGKVNIKVG